MSILFSSTPANMLVSGVYHGILAAAESFIASALRIDKLVQRFVDPTYAVPSLKDAFALGLPFAVATGQKEVITFLDQHTTKFQESYPKLFAISNLALGYLTTAGIALYMNTRGYCFHRVFIAQVIGSVASSKINAILNPPPTVTVLGTSRGPYRGGAATGAFRRTN